MTNFQTFSTFDLKKNQSKSDVIKIDITQKYAVRHLQLYTEGDNLMSKVQKPVAVVLEEGALLAPTLQ